MKYIGCNIFKIKYLVLKIYRKFFIYFFIDITKNYQIIIFKS